MTASNVSICLLYPDLLGTYGDGGNAKVLLRRLHWRGLSGELTTVSIDEPIPEQADIYLLGGGEDQPQTLVTDQLAKSRSLSRGIERGAAVLAVCAGMQIIGDAFAVANGQSKSGLGLIDVTTTRGEGERRVGELAVESTQEIGIGRLTGYENHGGVTHLGPMARPLGLVLAGHGNGDGHGTEGVVQGRIIGTYLHGPVLARNPRLADLLLGWVVGAALAPIDDREVDALREERFAVALVAERKRRFRLRRNAVS